MSESNNQWSGRERESLLLSTHQPFPVALRPLLVELLHCSNHASPRLSRPKRLLVDPTLEHRAEAAATEHAVRTEVACGCP